MRYEEEKLQRSLLVEDERYGRLAEKRRMQHELNVIMRVLMKQPVEQHMSTDSE